MLKDLCCLVILATTNIRQSKVIVNFKRWGNWTCFKLVNVKSVSGVLLLGFMEFCLLFFCSLLLCLGLLFAANVDKLVAAFIWVKSYLKHSICILSCIFVCENMIQSISTLKDYEYKVQFNGCDFYIMNIQKKCIYHYRKVIQSNSRNRNMNSFTDVSGR